MITYGGLSYVRMRIEGAEVPDTVQLQVVSVRSHYTYSLPTFSIVVRDTARELANAIIDNAQVELMVSQRKEDNTAWMPFRIFSYSSQAVSNFGIVYEIHGYYDYRTYLYSRVTRAFSGPSSSIVQTLAEEGGLRANVDTTSESDTNWYCSRRTLASFMREDVIPAATAGKDSIMMSVIDARNNTWCYRNLAKVVESEVVSRLVNSSVVNPGEYHAMFHQHRYTNNSGFHNVLGYSMKNARYDVTRGEFRDDNSIEVVKTSSRLSMNTDIPESSYVHYPTLDFGNNGAGAANRGLNMRQRALWSMGVDILISEYSPFDLLTLHQLHFLDDVVGNDRRLSGNYVCVGRTVAATPNEYREALSFLRNSESVENERTMS